jgi:CRISPR-associated endonuclease Csn1
MKKILGLDLGTNSIGWALVNEANQENERASIIKIGSRVIHYGDNYVKVDSKGNISSSMDPEKEFNNGKSLSPNACRTKKRGARRNLQRYKLRRENLIEILKESGFIKEDSLLYENGNKTTFETYHLRSKAVTEEVSLEQLARILLMINKKRGYKSSRKAKSQEEGQLIDGMEIAMSLYNDNLTPGQFVYQRFEEGKKSVPDFYRSDLQAEFNQIWAFQKLFYPEILTDDFKKQIINKGKLNTAKIFLGKYGIYTSDNKGSDKIKQSYIWRNKALNERLTKEEVAYVISDLNGLISNSSGYLGSISDRSKELYFNKKTVGQYLKDIISKDPNCSLKNKIFYRQDYLDEFNTIWETQAKYHKELTDELKSIIRDVVIFYQRSLKSQKGLVSFCEFESRQVEIEIDGKKKIKTVGSKVCPKSSPLFQEFKIWQNLNNVQVLEKANGAKRFLLQEEKDALFSELNLKSKISKDLALRILFENHKELDLNFKELEGNRTQESLFKAYQSIIELSGNGVYDFSKMNACKVIEIVDHVFSGLGYNTEMLHFNSKIEGDAFIKQPMYQLWNLLYSFEGDKSNSGIEKLVAKISEKYGFESEYAIILANVIFQSDYSSLSTKAIRKILPYLKDGFAYAGRNEFPDEPSACEYAGYKHSKNSLTKEEVENKVLIDKLNILPKDSLRNPVVEKILNQMINVVNTVISTYGKPDEIRIELARELKKSAKEREKASTAISQITAENEKYRLSLQKEFGLTNVSRNDIIRYRLYLELESNGFNTLYSNTYISPGKLFSKDFDIEHIIPQSRLFDDSFSNKTLESKSINIDKGSETAYDYILKKQGREGLDVYLERIENLYNAGKISKTKYNRLKMKSEDIPCDFINRDLRDTQYIARKAKFILEDLVNAVVSTTGSVTDRLREDWQLVDVLQELNWEKYDKIGLTETLKNNEEQTFRRIKDWTKRNDHRNHAMDALTIAFTKPSYIQYLNNLNSRNDKAGSIYAIEKKELYRDDRGKLRFKPPIPIRDFRIEAKRQLENTLVSVKPQNKVTTLNINITKRKDGENMRKQLTPRGQLHQETIYGSIQRYVTKFEKVGSNFDEAKVLKVAKKSYREALLNRLCQYGSDPNLAFTGKNSLKKNPIFLDELQTFQVPEIVKTVIQETIYTIKKDIDPDLKIEKVIDSKIRSILEDRLKEYNGDTKKAFSNKEENPIWINKEKAISIKRVTISDVSNVEALHDKKNKEGELILDKDGKDQPVDFVSTGNNHHVAIYIDEKGNLQDNVVSFFEATTRANLHLPIIDKDYKKEEGWRFLFSMKKNECFVFPNEKTGFKPNEIDLMDYENYSLVSPNLFRLQKISKVTYGNSAVRDYVFRHHLETFIRDNKELKDITYKSIKSLSPFHNIVKVRINHIGNIVFVGEY